jgi:hypothetical protein
MSFVSDRTLKWQLDPAGDILQRLFGRVFGLASGFLLRPVYGFLSRAAYLSFGFVLFFFQG